MTRARYIPSVNLSTIDVNLVVALDALLRERNVTRAARRVGLSQPAMSHALMRLREALRDPLLVRVGRNMALTERAEAMTGQVAAIMHDLAGLFGGGPPSFDPDTSTRAFRIAATDYVYLQLLSRLNAALARNAPRTALHALSLGDMQAADALRRGEIDLAIGVFPPDTTPPDVLREELFQERFVGLARLKHPTARGRIDLETYAGLSHVLVPGRGPEDGAIDDVLAGRGIARRAVMTVPNVQLAAHIVADSDIVATVTERVERVFSGQLALRTFELPFDLPPVEFAMLCHSRMAGEPALGWLRRLVTEAAITPHEVGRRKRK
jgi:DNA-binding transcriptional LysR family regulator